MSDIDTVEVVRRRLADGRTIADSDVHWLVAEIDRLRARITDLTEELHHVMSDLPPAPPMQGTMQHSAPSFWLERWEEWGKQR